MTTGKRKETVVLQTQMCMEWYSSTVYSILEPKVLKNLLYGKGLLLRYVSELVVATKLAFLSY